MRKRTEVEGERERKGTGEAQNFNRRDGEVTVWEGCEQKEMKGGKSCKSRKIEKLREGDWKRK